MKQLACGSLTVLATAIHTPGGGGGGGRDAGPCKAQRRGAGVWGLWSDLRARAADDCGETSRGDVREETVVGKCLWRKGRQPWKQDDDAESHEVGGAITMASLPTGQHQQLSNREAGPSNCLLHYRVGPQQGAPLSA